MEARSPLSHIASARGPILVFQGANDPRVTRAQSDAMVASLTARGLPVTYLVAGNEGHGWNEISTARAVSRAEELFLRRCLGGTAQAAVQPDVERALGALTVDPRTVKGAH